MERSFADTIPWHGGQEKIVGPRFPLQALLCRLGWVPDFNLQAEVAAPISKHCVCPQLTRRYSRLIAFQHDGSTWISVSPTLADIPN